MNAKTKVIVVLIVFLYIANSASPHTIDPLYMQQTPQRYQGAHTAHKNAHPTASQVTDAPAASPPKSQPPAETPNLNHINRQFRTPQIGVGDVSWSRANILV